MGPTATRFAKTKQKVPSPKRKSPMSSGSRDITDTIVTVFRVGRSHGNFSSGIYLLFIENGISRTMGIRVERFEIILDNNSIFTWPLWSTWSFARTFFFRLNRIRDPCRLFRVDSFNFQTQGFSNIFLLPNFFRWVHRSLA